MKSNFQNWFMEKIATPRWLKEFGRLSSQGKKTIAKKVSRSPEQLAEGMRMGTANILKTRGGRHDVTPSVWQDLKKGKVDFFREGMGGYTVDTGSGSPIIKSIDPNNALNRFLTIGHSLFDKKRDRNIRDALGLAHEGYEVSKLNFGGPEHLTRIKKEVKPSFLQRLLRGALSFRGLQHLARTKEEVRPSFFQRLLKKEVPSKMIDVGAHKTLSVLGRESNDILRLRAAGMSDKSLVDPINRAQTGETNILKKLTGKEYGTDFFGRKDMASLDRASRLGEVHSTLDGKVVTKAYVDPFANLEDYVQQILDSLK